MDTTIDGILGQRVQLEQPAKGFRVAIDTVLLAAAIPAIAGQHVLDMGCGVGGAMLCLAKRVPGIEALGVEIQKDLVEICERNIIRNKFVGVTVEQGDVAHLSNLIGQFDCVIMNPPYHDEASHDASENKIKRTANTEKSGDLDFWIMNASKALNSRGSLFIIHRADRRSEILGKLNRYFRKTEILPIISKPGDPAIRMLIRAQFADKNSHCECQPIVMHKPEGGYTDAAEAVLRHAEALPFTPI